jgi:hypothetical protein
MTSKKPSEPLFGDRDLPTTSADVLALRLHRPRAGADWLEDLVTLAKQMPDDVTAALRRRRTFAGLPPFEL